MKTLFRFFAAFAAGIALSLLGRAENLPFGVDAMRQYSATNIGVVAVQAVQYHPDTGDEIVFMGSNLGIKFNNYSEFVQYVRGKLRTAEGRFKEPKLLPAEDMIVYVGAGLPTWIGDFHYSFSDLRRVTLVKDTAGIYKFPEGFIESYEPSFDSFPAIRTEKAAEWATIKVINDQGEVETDDDSRKPPVGRQPDAYVDGSKTLRVNRNYVVNDPSKTIRLTVGFTDGTIKHWGGDGREISLSNPILSVELVSDQIELVVRGGNINDTLSIDGTIDGKTWKNVQKFMVTDSEMRFSVSPGTNSLSLYRLRD